MAGERHQDGKLLQRGGEAYRHYLETTSMVPFAAIVAGRTPGCRRSATGCRQIRDAPSGPDFGALPFTSLYLLEDERAAEIANRTMHGVMHIVAAIRPFRHLIVYPSMLREMGRMLSVGEWRP